MRYILLTILLFSFNSLAKSADGWHEAIPPNFDRLENFFLAANCSPTLGVSYLYDGSTGRWLGKNEAEALFPNSELYLAPMGKFDDSVLSECTLKSDKQMLLDVFGVDLEQVDGKALFFFDIFYTPNGERLVFNKASDNKMIARFEELSKFESLPKYHIKVNTVGINR